MMRPIEDAIRVQLVDAMGSDLTVVNAARVSFDKESDWEYETVVEWEEDGKAYVEYKRPIGLKEKDKKLIRFLAREGHTTPFRHVQLQFRCKAPIFLARQLGKYQVGHSWNEVSRRYVDSEPEFYSPECWRKRPEDGIKQGSSEECVGNEYEVDTQYWEAVQESVKAYHMMLANGVAPEMARMVLPQSMVTEWIWTGSLYGFFNVYRQRIDGHAQKEAQYFAKLLDETIPDRMRFSWETLKEFNP